MMHAAAMALSIPSSSCCSRSNCLLSWQLANAKPLLHLRCRRHGSGRKPSTAVRAELRTSEATAATASSSSSSIPTHRVTVHDRQRGVVHEFLVPEDQYILHTAESQNISLPFACRHGCCTSCAVRVKSGQIRQPEALGISAELKAKGYALLCVGFPSSDVEVETQDEDEVYWLQFGRYFARGPIERDDYALELAMGDE
ncbi:2Fe-2S iron-sulfur cluster binding domain [Musa troglodytarum]|uniref:2Fe-2S iron-sulfur cluster binding domain n=1 Tax=Musa troglodytarum TaxID=320322 RepID=A0A9E7JFT6_9LILI|nr:2Fe-2S iron-sulfur cluster binding domain [Musa troglodytarum]URD79575.1 2Fe-2S iron-sulfur cluster binding domain [Musa troglodytarum]